jgi:hypothetical protein
MCIVCVWDCEAVLNQISASQKKYEHILPSSKGQANEA